MSQFVPKEILDDILLRLDAVQVVSEFIELKKSGKDYRGLCPFHEEKTPSFWVSPEKGVYYCFGCGEGGNLFRFIMKKENVAFPEAVRKLARLAGVDLGSLEEREAHRDLYRINQFAAWFFSQTLKTSERAKDFLEKRGVRPETAEIFHLGYAPPEWEGLSRFLHEKKVPMEAASALGLIRKRKDGSHYDFFRDRLIYPILDSQDRVVAFGGRRIAEDQEAKYLNSSESFIYHKGREIYGLPQAKAEIRKKREIILVEGYMDVIRIYQAGFKNAVAPLGTAITENQVRILKPLADRILLVYDGDEAGRRAMVRSAPIFFGAHLHPRVGPLPEGEDPDSMVHQGGEAFTKILDQAKPLMEWLIHRLPTAGDIQNRLDAAKPLMALIQNLEPLEAQTYQARIKQFLGITEGLLPEFRGRRAVRKPQEGKKSLERILLGLYVLYPHLMHADMGEDFFEDFEDPELKGVGCDLFRQYQSHAKFRLDHLIHEDSLGPEPLLGKLLGAVPVDEENSGQYIRDCFFQWRKMKSKKELKELTEKIRGAEASKDEAKLELYLGQKNKIIRGLKGLY